ncbi:ABC transporter substrate-binding protein [Paucihalobacter ruber]|uniref:ABC transporter substrate-binding protein n=1 Tax=Paucihalobacter ruber TaxID=2567861 RepID=A0A506PMJ5_9FLAO|nr:ABC transporter substrate-binding protein [Paucihalobacter ruber]TPV34748.1 ABC transporter substrate-binding protein [Paucihalobacter ruber]
MKKAFFLGCFVALCFSAFGQNFSNLWEAHFSYNKIVGVRAGDSKIYAASENVLFVYDTQTNETFNITTVDGLSGEFISAIEYSEEFRLLIIGYTNGLIEIYSEANGTILPVVDILERETISPGLKTINHFNEHEGLMYIATGFGIVVYNLESLEFGDTYFIGLGASQVAVEQTAVLNGFIYAACRDNAAIKFADLSNPNLIDFAQWQTISSGNFITMDVVNNRLYTTRSNNTFNEIVNNTLQLRFSFPSVPRDTKAAGEILVVTINNTILLLDGNGVVTSSFGVNPDFQTTYNSAVVFSEFLYIGTENLGLLKIQLSDFNNIQAILPNGPLRNDPFKINAFSGQVWVTYGDHTAFYNPFPLRSRGLNYRIDDTWNSIPFEGLQNARNLTYIAANPFNNRQVFISAFQDGLLELNNFESTVLFNQTNSGLESLIDPNAPNFVSIRVNGLSFDRTGKLWSITSLVERPLKSYDPATGNWQSYSFAQLIENPITGENGFGDLVVDNNGTKWIGSKRNGLIAYNENVSGTPILKIDSQSQNMPNISVEAIALDNRNQLWIGTVNGLRVLFNTANIFNTPNPSVNSIIIDERGVPRELLLDELITDIKVDGSNNKWVGTLSSGVFYFSQDGQQTIFHFTRDNSPLPSNQINDIAVDDVNGVVYFATSRGLVAFTSGSSAPEETLGEAFVYPNPVRPEYDILGDNNLNDINRGVKIKGLTENVNIKITDVEGNLVAEAQSRRNLRNSRAGFNMAIDGGIAIWNGRNLANNIVASGVYLILITDLDSFETKVLKLLIIRGK